MKCRSCGAEVTDNAVFCVYCGTKRTDRQEAAAPVAQQAPASSASVFRMVVEDVFTITGRGSVVVGKIASGNIWQDADIVIKRKNGTVIPAKVDGIEEFRKILTSAHAGMNVGILLKEITKNDVSAGDSLEGLA